jgi:hypothetical protein
MNLKVVDRIGGHRVVSGTETVPDWDGRINKNSPTVEEAVKKGGLYAVYDPDGRTGRHGKLFHSAKNPKPVKGIGFVRAESEILVLEDPRGYGLHYEMRANVGGYEVYVHVVAHDQSEADAFVADAMRDMGVVGFAPKRGQVQRVVNSPRMWNGKSGVQSAYIR